MVTLAQYHLRGDQFPHVEDWGQMAFMWVGGVASAVGSLGLDGNGHLVAQSGAQFGMGSVSLHVQGGDAWDSLINTILDANKARVGNAICQGLANKIAAGVKSMLSKIPTSISIAAGTKWNMVLPVTHVAPPVSTSDNSISMFLDGRLSPDGHQMCPFNTTTHLPAHQLSASSKFIEIAMTATSIQCAMWSQVQKGILSFKVTDEKLPSAIPYRLLTNCTAWASLAPGLATSTSSYVICYACPRCVIDNLFSVFGV